MRRSPRLRWVAAALPVLALLSATPGTASGAGAAGAETGVGAVSSAEDVRDEQWWLDIMGVEKVWANHTRGKGVVVAVIDDGVHPGGDLEGAVLPGFNQAGSGRGDVGDPDDFHGTTMATEIAGRGTGPGIMGVAPQATILPVKIPNAIRRDYTVQALRTLAAMDDPPEIVNMSYGGVGECSPDEQAAVREAVDAGMILVVSMGNDHTGRELPATPASCAGVLAVGAYGYFGELADRPDVRMWQKSEQQPYAALAAPGMRMLAFKPGTNQRVYFDGTSDAAAIASGSIALVRAAFPDMPSRELVARLLATARPLDDSYGVRSPQWGFGAVRPRHAIEDDVPADAPNPVYDALDEAVPPAQAASAEPSPSGDPSDASVAGETAEDSSSTVVVLVVVGAAVAVALLVLALVLSRRGRRRAGGPGSPA